MDLVEVRFQRLAYIDKLVIERFSAVRNLDHGILIRLEFPLIALQPFVCSDCSSTSIVIEFLSISIELSELAIRRYPDMGCKEDHQVSSLWHMLSESVVTLPTEEWDPSEPSHVAAFASYPTQPIVQRVRVVVDFIWAHARGEQCISRLTAFFDQCEDNPLVQRLGELCTRKVLFDLHHGVFLHPRMVRLH